MNAVPNHDAGSQAGHQQAGGIALHGIAHRVKSEDYPKAQEKKANHFIPQGVDGLNDGGHNVPHKLRADADCPVFPHVPIVTNGRVRNFPWCAAAKVPIECMGALVKPGSDPLQSKRVDAGPWVERRLRLAHPSILGELCGRATEALMQELGNAINDSLSESERIAEAIGEIKKAGYDVFLVLEATIGFNRRDGDEEDAEELEITEEQQPPQPAKKTFEATGKIKLTTQDHRFLRALKIAVDDDR